MFRQQQSESQYVIDVDNVLGINRLRKFDQHLSEGLGLFPPYIDPPPLRLLDVGCGIGNWALTVAWTYPQATVTAIDISTSLIRHNQLRAQPRVHFLQADARQPLPFTEASFDFVHARMANAWLTTTLWPRILLEYFRVLQPEGMLCCIETENVGVTNSPALTRYNALSMQAMRETDQCFPAQGNNMGITTHLPLLFQQAGFQSLQQQVYEIDYSYGQPGYQVMTENLEIGLPLMHPFLLKQKVVQETELHLLYEQVVQEMQSSSFRGQVSYVRITGKKPQHLEEQTTDSTQVASESH